MKYITDGGAGEVTIPWQSSDINNVSGKYVTLQLEDESGNKLADIKSETSYTFTAEPGVLYSFQIKAVVEVDTTPPADVVDDTVYSPNKPAILAPWIALGSALVGGIIWLVRRRRRAHG